MVQHWLTTHVPIGTQWGWTLAALGLVLYLFGYPTFLVIRFARASRRTKRHYLTAWRARFRWRWLTRNLGLAIVDKDTKVSSRVSNVSGKAVQVQKPKTTVRYPKAKIRPDDYGLVIRIKPLPGVGKTQFENQTEHLANAWRCRRVQVLDGKKPGRIIVRALRRDPLADPLTPADVPAGVYVPVEQAEAATETVTASTGGTLNGSPLVDQPRPNRAARRAARKARRHLENARVYVGRDEWGQHRWLAMSNLAGITVGGLAGYGKTSLIASLLYQWAASPAVQFALIDGKGGTDYEDFAPRAWIYSGDDIDRALAAARALHAVMRHRTANIRRILGVKNAWDRGPSPELPLVIMVWDECHTFFDMPGNDGSKETKELRAKIQELTSLCAQLVKKGRSVMMLSIFITQKQTGDAIPTAIRDNCAVGLSFATRTKEAAVAGLGEGIREYPSLCPTTLKERPTFQGVCTAALGDGSEDFTRLRVPHFTEEELGQRARETAHLKRGQQEITDARIWERTAPIEPTEEWLIPIERLEQCDICGERLSDHDVPCDPAVKQPA